MKTKKLISCLLIRIVSVSILVVSSTYLASCTNKSKVPKREKVSFYLDWKTGSEHSFLYYGVRERFFSDEGIDLEIIPGTGSSASANMVDKKAVDFALCSGESAIAARSANPPRNILILAVFYPNTPTCIFALEEKKINTPNDLYGKRLGIIKGSSSYRNYVAFAKKNGLDRTRINEVPTTGDVRELINKNSTLDAMVQFVFQEPLQLKVAGYKISEIKLSDYGIKIYGQSLITNPDYLELREDLVVRITRAVQKSYLETILHPEEAFEAFIKEFPEQDNKYAREKLNYVIDFVKSGIPENQPIGYQDANGWQSTISYLHDQGLLERDVRFDTVWTNRFLDKKFIISKGNAEK